MNKMLLMLGVLAVSGCETIAPNTIHVAYVSEPRGAMLYEATPQGENSLGMAPQTFVYSVSEQQKSQGQVITFYNVTARWASGATATIMPMYDPKIGNAVTYTIQRPPNAPGLGEDMRFALELERSDAEFRGKMATKFLEGISEGQSKSSQSTPIPRTQYTTCEERFGKIECETR